MHEKVETVYDTLLKEQKQGSYAVWDVAESMLLNIEQWSKDGESAEWIIDQLLSMAGDYKEAADYLVRCIQ